MNVKNKIRIIVDQFSFLDSWREKRYIKIRKKRLYSKINSTPEPLKIILGSGQTEYEGWVATDLPFFNVLSPEDWSYYFSTNPIDNLLAEHVLEHLSEEEVKKVLQLAFQYLKKEGCFRIAVPDKNHPNPNYIEYVRPGGTGPGADDHKSFWDCKKLSALCTKCGFTYQLKEYYDSDGAFHQKELEPARGKIQRTRKKGSHYNIKDYSSLIIDAIKA